MVLRATVPEDKQERLKLHLYGTAGSGKTYAAIQFPKPYLIDTEDGSKHSEYRELLIKSGGVKYQTTSIEDVITELRSLLMEKHEYKTVIIDSLTALYYAASDEAAKKVGTAYAANTRLADIQLRRVLNYIYKLDMNVVAISYPKNVKDEENIFDITNQIAKGYADLNHVFDLALNTERKKAKPPTATVTKTRVKGFLLGDVFDFSFDAVGKRYGFDSFQKDSVPIVLASKKHLEELRSLIKITGTSQDTIHTWLDKAQVQDIADLPEDLVLKTIKFLKSEK